MAEPLVFVLVINWNGREHLQACFESLLETTYGNVRFLLLDNGSTDDSVPFVRMAFGQDPRVDIVELGENLGWSRGNNAGLKMAMEAGAKYVVLLNNDTWTAPETLTALVNAAEADSDVAAVAPKMLMFDNPEIINSLGLVCSVIGNTWDLGIGRLDRSKWNDPRDVVGFCGGAALLRVDALRETGLLPTDFDIYLDDLDLSLRMWNAGYRIRNCPEAIVHHKFSATMGRGDRWHRKYYLNTRNRFRVMSRNFPRNRWRQVIPAVLRGEAKALGRAILDREFWKVTAHGQAWWDNARTIRIARQARRGLPAQTAFWDLIVQDSLFFSGTEFPVDGWYQPVTKCGISVRPISQAAKCTVQHSQLRVHYANPYPNLGVPGIELCQEDRIIAAIQTTGVGETTIDVRPGPLEFRAKHIFDADDTGERFDIGGWLRIEAGESS